MTIVDSLGSHRSNSRNFSHSQPTAEGEPQIGPENASKLGPPFGRMRTIWRSHCGDGKAAKRPDHKLLLGMFRLVLIVKITKTCA